MKAKTLLAAALFCAVPASADTVYRWVDEHGVTHFSQKAFATTQAEAVEVEAANAMDVPDASSLDRGAGRASFHRISKAGKKNKDGWTGYRPQHRGRSARGRAF